MKRMVSQAVIYFVTMTCFAAGTGTASAQEPYFKGKTIRLVVGLAPGGGFDTYSRAIGRRMGKHIPGNPAIIVDNMPGAASLVSANFLYKVAKPDGLTIGNFVGGIAMHELFGKPGIEFQATKFEYLGVPAQDNFMLGVAKSTGVTSVEKWIASGTVLKFGGVAPGGGTDDLPKVVKSVLGLPLQLVTGYKGTGPIRLAFNSGEVQGVSNSIESFNSTWTHEMEKGDVVIILQETVKPHPAVPNVPLALDLAKTEEGKKLIRAQATINGVTNRLYALPPGTPAAVVQTLRKAFMATLKDPEFLADAKKARLDIDPIDGAAIAKEVKGLFNLDRSLVEKLKEILK
jgi:tripartite-type tricarboxylate transporter receptor subunit TctC